ncbi:MAG: TldD/PmbA family protein [Bryobacteraceae bacterium]
MLTREQAKALSEKILGFSKFPDCTVNIIESEEAFIRFANNGVTTSGFTNTRRFVISSTREQKTGTALTNDLDDASLKSAVARSEELSAVSPPNQEYVEPIGPQKYAEASNWDDETSRARSPILVPQVKAVIDAASRKGLVAAGLFSRTAEVSSIANKRGNFGFERRTDAGFSTTVRAADGSSSGWSSHPAVRIREIKGADLAAQAVEKCLKWKKPLRLEPGKYNVVLEPTAVGDLMEWLFFGFSARSAEEGRSFLSKKGGGTQMGEKLFPEIVTLRSAPDDRRFPTSLWSQGGLPQRPNTWIQNGVVKGLAYDRYWAMKSGKEPNSGFGHLILEGTSASLADLIKATERGLLVTRFWYIRTLNPQTVQLTGLTRDGLFLIENGEVTQPVVNFRFNESPVRLLQNITKIGTPQRVAGGEGDGMIAPPVQASNFTFSSVSDAV